MTDKLTVSAIGSCRVFTPINTQRSLGKINVAHGGAEWYTHTTREALQKLKIVQRKVTVPDELVPLVVETNDKKWHPEAHSPDFYDKTDVFVVEICSRKIFSGSEFYFQQWCVQKVLHEQDTPQALLQKVNDADKRVQSQAEVLKDMKLLCDRLGKPVIFVSHINVPMANGKPFVERNAIRDILQSFCASDPRAVFFDPTPTVQQHGVADALIDSGHYKPDFNKVIGAELFDLIQRHLSLSKVA